MVFQVPQVGETLPALVAHELFLPGVDLLVGFQAVSLVEAASARVAGVRLLSRVDSLVPVEVADAAEALPARVAAERLLPRVDRLKNSDVAPIRSFHPTWMKTSAKKTHLVRLQAAVLRKRPSTEAAGERPLPAVRLQVDLEVA